MFKNSFCAQYNTTTTENVSFAGLFFLLFKLLLKKNSWEFMITNASLPSFLPSWTYLQPQYKNTVRIFLQKNILEFRLIKA